MLLKMYALPRRLKGYGSVSAAYEPFQGILAGCTHAVCMLEVLALGVIRRVCHAHQGLAPRALVDDVSVQYTGDDPRGDHALDVAVPGFVSESRILGSKFNCKKSGCARHRGHAQAIAEAPPEYRPSSALDAQPLP